MQSCQSGWMASFVNWQEKRHQNKVVLRVALKQCRNATSDSHLCSPVLNRGKAPWFSPQPAGEAGGFVLGGSSLENCSILQAASENDLNLQVTSSWGPCSPTATKHSRYSLPTANPWDQRGKKCH